MSETDWKSADTAPYGKVIEVKNATMNRPVLATRGYVHHGAVHADQGFFTSVYTDWDWDTFPSGKLVIPTVWRESGENAGKGKLRS